MNLNDDEYDASSSYTSSLGDSCVHLPSFSYHLFYIQTAIQEHKATTTDYKLHEGKRDLNQGKRNLNQGKRNLNLEKAALVVVNRKKERLRKQDFVRDIVVHNSSLSNKNFVIF